MTSCCRERALEKSWKLYRNEEFKKVWIKHDVNEEESAKIKELWQEAEEKDRRQRKGGTVGD